MICSLLGLVPASKGIGGDSQESGRLPSQMFQGPSVLVLQTPGYLIFRASTKGTFLRHNKSLTIGICRALEPNHFLFSPFPLLREVKYTRVKAVIRTWDGAKVCQQHTVSEGLTFQNYFNRKARLFLIPLVDTLFLEHTKQIFRGILYLFVTNFICMAVSR